MKLSEKILALGAVALLIFTLSIEGVFNLAFLSVCYILYRGYWSVISQEYRRDTQD